MARYSREQLLDICVCAFTPHDEWRDRDSAAAVRQLGEAYALLRAGCDFKVLTSGDLVTDDRTVWITVTFDGFSAFEGGLRECATFYLPTPERLLQAEGGDWY